MLPNIECDARGVRPRAVLCQQIGVKGYPTWTINGRRYEGMLTLAQLPEASRFQGARAP